MTHICLKENPLYHTLKSQKKSESWLGGAEDWSGMLHICYRVNNSNEKKKFIVLTSARWHGFSSISITKTIKFRVVNDTKVKPSFDIRLVAPPTLPFFSLFHVGLRFSHQINLLLNESIYRLDTLDDTWVLMNGLDVQKLCEKHLEFDEASPNLDTSTRKQFPSVAYTINFAWAILYLHLLWRWQAS